MTKTATRTLVFNGASQEAAEAADSIEAPWRTESFWRVNNADWEPHFYKLVIGRITSPGLHGSVTHDDVTVYFMADGSPVEDPESQPWEMNGNATRVGCDLLRSLARQMQAMTAGVKRTPVMGPAPGSKRNNDQRGQTMNSGDINHGFPREEREVLRERVEHDLTLHPPVDECAGEGMDKLRAAAKTFALECVGQCATGRELSLALTKIEEALFFAIAAVARYQPSEP